MKYHLNQRSLIRPSDMDRLAGQRTGRRYTKRPAYVYQDVIDIYHELYFHRFESQCFASIVVLEGAHKQDLSHSFCPGTTQPADSVSQKDTYIAMYISVTDTLSAEMLPEILVLFYNILSRGYQVISSLLTTHGGLAGCSFKIPAPILQGLPVTSAQVCSITC